MDTKDIYRQLLPEALKIASVSTDPKFRDEISRMAKWWTEQFRKHGFKVQTYTGYGNPIILASYRVDPQAETLLIYGHYDVQPADQSEGWQADPFSLYEDNSRLYGRGVADNKGQVLIHVATAFDLIQKEKLGYNLLFLMEGEEEVGSPRLNDFLRDQRSKLQADAALISDGEVSEKKPVIELGFRGVINGTIGIKTAHNDLHSGLFGPAVPNASHSAARLISRMHRPNGKVAVPHFYQGAKAPTGDLGRTSKQKITEFLKLAGVKKIYNEKRLSPATTVGSRPALEITGVRSGYTGEGYRNSIPATAEIKFNIRLVPGQKPEIIKRALKKWIREQLPETQKTELELTPHIPAVKLESQNTYINRAVQALSEVTGQQPEFQYSGGTLPIATYLKQIPNLAQVYVPLANDDCQMHGVNENLNKKQLERGLEFSSRFLSSDQ